MTNSFEFFKNYILTGSNDTVRIQQAEILDKLLTEEFNFDYVECIETGCSYGGYDDFGTYLGHFCQEKNGKLSTVDIVKESIDKSKIFYTTLLPNLQVEFCIGDSIEFLKKYNGYVVGVDPDPKSISYCEPIKPKNMESDIPTIETCKVIIKPCMSSGIESQTTFQLYLYSCIITGESR